MNELYSSIIASAMDAIVVVDSSQRIVVFNAAAEAMFGYSAEEVAGKGLAMLIPQRYRRSHRGHVARFGKTTATKRRMGDLGSIFGLRKDGREFPIEASISQALESGKRYYSVILRDISEKKAKEDRLIEQAGLLDHSRDAILAISPDGRILFWNRSAGKIFGVSQADALGKHAQEIICPDGPELFETAKETALREGEWSGEIRLAGRKDSMVFLESNWAAVKRGDGSPHMILIASSDVTEKRKFESQLLRAQRLESIGTLAGGIAHDLNNILSPIMMSLELLREMHLDAQSQELLETSLMMTERGADMVKQILSFARGAEGEKIALNPRFLIKEIIKILRDAFPKNISIKQEIAEGLANVSGDVTQLHQVLMNLCVNARDAMPYGGSLTFSAKNIDLDENYAKINFDARSGSYVLLEISDTGMGIAPEILHKIFDPFFTTKEKSKGTGLGLSTSAGIIRGHGGFINVYSESGNGSKFSIYLPALAEKAGIAKDREDIRKAGSNEAVLLVDDEAAMLEIAARILEAVGYRVLKAQNGTEALRIFMENRKLGAIITDIMMPKMNGIELIRQIREIDREVLIIACSGIDNGNETEAMHFGANDFLHKPYPPKALRDSLAALLAKRKSAE